MSDSPFKFLNAYNKLDEASFFGREKESEDLYELTYDTRLILLYGASGTGKTSLIQCGLANKFRDSHWLGIFVRRSTNIIEAIREALYKELGDLANRNSQSSILELIEQLYFEKFKPIYFLLDQFEELFILNPNKEEQQEFFELLDLILNSKVSCKFIIIMREEFIAQLWEYESIIPYLFDHRYRVEKMRLSTLEEVVEKTLDRFEKKGVIQLEDKTELAHQIVQKLQTNTTDPELTYLQVYLHRLYQLASQRNKTLPIFNTALINELGSFEDVIGDFLTDQLRVIETQLGVGKEGIPLRILGALVTDAHTKKVVSPDYLEQIRQNLNITKNELEHCIQAFESMRIIQRYD